MAFITGYKSRITSKINISDTTSDTFTLADDPGADGAYTLKLQNEENTLREWFKVTTVGTTATIVLRGLSTSSPLTEVTANKRQWREGSIVKIVADKDDLLDVDDSGLSFGDGTAADQTITFRTDQTTDPTFFWDDSDGRFKITWGDDAPASGVIDGVGIPVLTTTERDARNWPDSGPIIFNSTTGEHEKRQTGSWTNVDTGGTFPNASATVAGKVEIATSAESIAGTDTGGTLASLSVLPSDIAANAQSNTFIFGSSTTGNDTYAFNATPAISSYAQGQKFMVKVDTANTGACSLNVNSVGAVAIKTQDGNDPASGDIPANGIIEVIYNSTGPAFVLQTPIANTLATTIASQAGAGNNGTDLYTSGTGAFDIDDNIDIDLSPFTSSNTVMLHIYASIQYTNVNGSVEYNSAVAYLSMLMGGAAALLASKSNIDGSATASEYTHAHQIIGTPAGSDSPTGSFLSCSLTPDSDSGIATIAYPAWSGSNLRFACNHAGTIQGASPVSLRPVCYISVLAIKFA